MILNVISPNEVLSPSAIVSVVVFCWIEPLSNERYASSTFDGSAPMALQLLPNARALKAMPEINPPPPTGTIIASNSGQSSSNSLPAEALPKITLKSLNGCTKVAPFFC